MNEPRPPAPPPRRRGAFEAQDDAPRRPRPGARPGSQPGQAPRPSPRELPRAPVWEPGSWTAVQIIGAALLAFLGIGLVVVMALGLPLELVGGKAVLVVPIIAVIMLMRGGGRR